MRNWREQTGGLDIVNELNEVIIHISKDLILQELYSWVRQVK